MSLTYNQYVTQIATLAVVSPTDPNFGTIIWNVLYEPFTEDLKSVIVTDIKAVAGYDPRVSFDNILVTEYEQGLQITLGIRYLHTNQSSVMNLNFDSQANQLFSS